jgi:hypothetical protein
MDRYRDAWNREDLDAILDCYHQPSFTYKPGELLTFLDARSRRDYVADFIEVNRREGPAIWEIVDFSLVSLGRLSALVGTRWVFRRLDGSVVWDFTDSYLLCRLDDRWRFLVRTLHDEAALDEERH